MSFYLYFFILRLKNQLLVKVYFIQIYFDVEFHWYMIILPTLIISSFIGPPALPKGSLISTLSVRPSVRPSIKLFSQDWRLTFPVGIYLVKVNNRNTKARFEICSKLTIKTPERRQDCL